jgi:hypothetical protein
MNNPTKSNLSQMLEKGTEGQLIHFNDIHVIVSGNKITPKPMVQCFHSERGDETIEDIQYMIDKLLENGRVVLSSMYYNDINFNLGISDNDGVPFMDIYFNTETDDENMYVIDMTEEFMNSIIRPK